MPPIFSRLITSAAARRCRRHAGYGMQRCCLPCRLLYARDAAAAAAGGALRRCRRFSCHSLQNREQAHFDTLPCYSHILIVMFCRDEGAFSLMPRCWRLMLRRCFSPCLRYYAPALCATLFFRRYALRACHTLPLCQDMRDAITLRYGCCRRYFRLRMPPDAAMPAILRQTVYIRGRYTRASHTRHCIPHMPLTRLFAAP